MDKKKVFKMIWIVVSLVCLCVSTVYLINYFISSKQEQSYYNDVLKIAGDTGKKLIQEKNKIMIQSLKQQTEYIGKQEGIDSYIDNPIDFITLTKDSPDIYGWIKVWGTVIDYPVLQHATDDTFYLTHLPDGRENIAGSIYTESLNSKQFADPNTVIYGHNMKVGSMFAELHNFADVEFFNNNKYFTIYTKDRMLEYEIFAAYLETDAHLLYAYNFDDPQIFEKYLKKVFKNTDQKANIRNDLKVTSDNCIVTLSTCEKGGGDGRFLIQGVLIEETKLKLPVSQDITITEGVN